jgi:hypothetical protein
LYDFVLNVCTTAPHKQKRLKKGKNTLFVFPLKKPMLDNVVVVVVVVADAVVVVVKPSFFSLSFTNKLSKAAFFDGNKTLSQFLHPSLS